MTAAPPRPIDADALTDMALAVNHCGQPMRFQHSATTWDGPPDLGAELTVIRRRCERCGTELTVTSRTPC